MSPAFRIAASIRPLAAGVALALTFGASAAASNAEDGRAVVARFAQLSLTPAPLADRERPAATLPVTSCADDGSDGTLRAAVASAVSGDTIDLANLPCSTITLAAGAIGVDVDDLTLQGPVAGVLTIDGANDGRVFTHLGAGTLTLNDLSLAHGTVVAPEAYGGCVYSNGSVSLSRSTVSSCSALGQTIAIGGGIAAKGSATLFSSEVSDNVAASAFGQGGIGAAGGGVFARDALVLVLSTISGNTADTALGKSYGGGCGTYWLTAKYSTLHGNHAVAVGVSSGFVAGGGAAVFDTAAVLGSTLDGNDADVAGALFVRYDDSDSVLTLSNSTVSANVGRQLAGGILTHVATEIANSTIAYNVGGPSGFGGLAGDGPSTELQSAIFAHNEPTDIDALSAVTGANSLVLSPGQVALPPDTISADPLLGPLENRGGPTRVHALLAGSPAIDAGNDALGFNYDQRASGFARLVGAAADIGAYETDPDRIFTQGFQ